MDENKTENPTTEEVDYAAKFDSIFSHNGDMQKEETMNRDYLVQIYGEEMDCLNKEIRMTRSEYLKETLRIDEQFEKDTADYKKKLRIYVILFGITLLIAIVILLEGLMWLDMYWDGVYSFANTGSSGMDNATLNGSYYFSILMFGLSAFFGLISGLEFVFCVVATLKKIKHTKNTKLKALQNLDEKRKELMLLGLYDAGR